VFNRVLADIRKTPEIRDEGQARLSREELNPLRRERTSRAGGF
jgi:hypothetical protein